MSWELLDFRAAELLQSARMLRACNLACLVGVLAAAWSLLAHLAQARRSRRAEEGPDRRSSASHGLVVWVLVAASLLALASVWYRYVEVNHFPSQTMGEVLVMTSLSLLAGMIVLHFAMRLASYGPGWAMMNDGLLAAVFAGSVAINQYASTLSTGERDLPPALQSYWFPPHLVTLIFSYATLSIAAVLVGVYFCVRFWVVLRHGGRSAGSQLLILAVLLLLPFTHLVTIPMLVLVGLVLLFGYRGAGGDSGRPWSERLAEMEATVDRVSFVCFAVGFPFLTAGLFMGAFWAQEAWANYWGWDSKENSALITWLIYLAYVHLRMLGRYRGEKAMAVLGAGALSVLITFQMFGYLPDSQKSLHRYTDETVMPAEGQQGGSMEEGR